MDAHPFVVTIAHIEEARSFQNETNLLVGMEMFGEERLQLVLVVLHRRLDFNLILVRVSESNEVTGSVGMPVRLPSILFEFNQRWTLVVRNDLVRMKVPDFDACASAQGGRVYFFQEMFILRIFFAIVHEPASNLERVSRS